MAEVSGRKARGIVSVCTGRAAGVGMNEVVRFDDRTRHRFAEAVEAAMAVRSRQQFFVWTQSSVQGLVPHQILICGVREAGAGGLRLQHFSASRYFRQSHFDAVADPVNGLVPRLLAVAERSSESVVICIGRGDHAARAALYDFVVDNELQNLAARPILGAHGEIEGIYGFARVALELDRDQQLQHAVELLIPHLHHTYLRVLQTEHDAQQAALPRLARVVTRRQREILLLVKQGKTNSEIADVLACSPWTVKNHIQNILRRLDSTSRAHAIARAMSMGILRPD